MKEQHSVGKSWYLIYTKPRGEELARTNLLQQGFDTYLPLVRRNKRQRGRYKPVIEALFPRYLFISLDMTRDNWMPIRSTIGVSNMVKFGGFPARVPARLVKELMLHEDADGLREEAVRVFTPGDEIELLDGALGGYRAIFEQYVSTERIAVLLDIVGKHTRMFVSRHNVQLAS